MSCARPINPKLQIAAGELRHKIQLQARGMASDGAGGYTETWTTVSEAWASIEPKSGMEIWLDGGLKTIGRTKVRMRYQPGISNDHRIVRVADGTIFNIREVLDIAFRHVVLEITCDEGGSDG